MTPEQDEAVRRWAEAWERTQTAYKELGYSVFTYGGRSKQARAARREVVAATAAEKEALAAENEAWKRGKESA